MKSHILSVIILVAVSLSVWAQPQAGQPYSGKSPREVRTVMNAGRFEPVQGLTDDQREAIRKVRTEEMKERTQTQNQLKEKKARLEVLQTADKPDMKEINKVIDEISSIRAKQMKAQAAGRQKIRSILTEEQRVYFDARFAEGKGRMQVHRHNEKPGRNDMMRAKRNPGDRPVRNIEKDNQ